MRYFLLVGVLASIGCGTTMHVPEEMKRRNMKMDPAISEDIPVQTPVTDEMTSEAYQKEMKTKVCRVRGEFTNESREACAKKWKTTFLARLSLAYPAMGSAPAFRTWCNAYPIQCDDPKTVELKVIELHDNDISRAAIANAEAANTKRVAAMNGKDDRGTQMRGNFLPFGKIR